MLKENETLDPDTEKKFGYLSLICNYKHEINYKVFKEQYVGEELFDFIEETKKCSDLFVPVITDEGLCYTFNILDRSQLLRDDVMQYKNFHKAPQLSNWTLDQGYPNTDQLITYPRRALFAGAIFALEAKLTTYEDDLDYVCGSSIQGYTKRIPKYVFQETQKL
ncbi:hypothetical protein NQ314_011745 [Rhamnusium bicolor]|uniref:Uncharacterized protein n=1 Tax=Rhamnusium bicolor TaxID=1586634 RepID=A0AAV8XGY0_9CUCU|nr:hypothetical protein NQ314_011745 [Rhamnusium bicolor]